MNQAIIQRHQNAQRMEQFQLRFDLRLREMEHILILYKMRENLKKKNEKET